MKTRSLMSLVVCLAALILPALAADWPQWRGPERTDVSRETGLLKTWPAKGPPLLWTYADAGVGFSGPAIVGNRLFTMGAIGNKEHVLALDTQTGKKIWSTEIGDLYEEGHGDGPRGTPTIDGDMLYAISAKGSLACLNVSDGNKRWSVSLTKDLGASKSPGWGYTESPLVDGDRVVCSPGGGKGTMAALDKTTGKVIWQSSGLTDQPGYSSIIVAEVGGVRQYLKTTMQAVVGVRASDGKLLWRQAQPEYKTAVIPTPIFHDNHIFSAAGYGAGCALHKLIPDGEGIRAEKVYANKNMVNHHGGVVLVGEHLYGFSDGGGGWTCMDFKSGKVIWSDKKLGKGCVTCADGMLYCFSENDGTLVLVEASPKGWKEAGRFKIPRETNVPRKRGKIWTHPVVANGRLYLRDEDLIFCFDVRDPKAGAQ